MNQILNTGTGTQFWLTVVFFAIISFLVYRVFTSVRELLKFRSDDKDYYQPTHLFKMVRKKVIIRSITLILTILALLFGYGSGKYHQETNPIKDHSMTIEVMKADSMPTNAEIEKDAINKMDKELLIMRNDSVRADALKQAEEDTEKRVC